ncbi:hypothetical protein [Spiroplasma sp. ChiS]|uniref:hypothetical protein n=1 Tax=Spiroplasma sp. ChiS TaxID=2099885 RepID=UPI0013922B37|nr:hypothetical protein [Spiroplasma sp. ChiS]
MTIKQKKINLTALGINNLNDLKTFSVVSLSDLEMTVSLIISCVFEWILTLGFYI